MIEIDIAARDDESDAHPGKTFAMPQNRRERDGRRGFNDDFHPLPHQAHRGDGLRVARGEHFDAVFAQEIEVDFADRRA